MYIKKFYKLHQGEINIVLLITTNLGLTLTGQTISLIVSTGGVGSLPPRYMKGCAWACNIEIMEEFPFESAQYSNIQ